MPKKRFSDEQIAFALRQAEAGTVVGTAKEGNCHDDVCRT
jgi:hypothetical protein